MPAWPRQMCPYISELIGRGGDGAPDGRRSRLCQRAGTRPAQPHRRDAVARGAGARGGSALTAEKGELLSGFRSAAEIQASKAKLWPLLDIRWY
jgi:hypothetical protein